MPAFWIKWRRALKRLWYWDIWHWQPSAPFHWRYFLPLQSEHIRLFRLLWWQSRYKLPGLLWLPLELLRCAHWRMFATERRVQSALLVYGAEVQARFGISLQEQQQHLRQWANTWCIEPFTSYHWQLYRPESDALAIIYDNQTAAYHALQNHKSGASKACQRLLSDKIALTQMLAQHGVPMVETAAISNGDWHNLEAALIQHSKLFCKLRSGNQAESAFAVWRDGAFIQGMAHDGTELPNEQAVRAAWQVLCAKGAVLIQPRLENHLSLAAVAVDEAVCTVRIVTRANENGLKAWWAELQVPARGPGRGFWRFPVSVGNGDLSVQDRQWFLKQAWQDEYDALWQPLSRLSVLPYWQTVVEHSLVSHMQLFKVWAIAWDWVITPEGPVLLEGNGGWGLREMQQQGFRLSPSP